MNRKATTSIVYKAPYPEMYIPEQLRSEITIKQFWYQKLISIVVALWYLATKPLRKTSSKVSEEKTPLEEESADEGKTPLEEKAEMDITESG